MFLRLLFLMTVVPIVELILILKVHGYVSTHWGANKALFFTVGTILLTGFVGAKLAKLQGFLLIRKAQISISKGRIPSQQMLEGLMLVAGAATLLTPGYLTDIFGILLLFPTSRAFFARILQQWIKKQVRSGRIHVHTSHQSGSAPHQRPRPKPGYEDVIDVEAQDEAPRSDR